MSRSPCSTIRPRYMTATSSATCRTTARSCAMKTYDSPNSRCSSLRRLMTCACTDTSSADTGSSQTRIFGRSARARAMPRRWRCPPENWCGWRCACPGSSPTISSSSRARVARSCFGIRSRWMSSGSRTISSAVIRGSSEVYGSCMTSWMSRLRRRSSADDSPSRSRPSTRTVPEVGRSRAIRRRARVDLPHPDSPTRPRVEPCFRIRSTPSTALTGARRRPAKAPTL